MSNPQYYVNGQPTSEGVCGESVGTTITFDVPGYNRAWIIVSQDGRFTFDGPMDLPMPPYALKCPQDVGFFQTAAYEITAEGKRGGVIGQTQFTVRNANDTGTTSPPYVPPLEPTAPPAPPSTGGTAPPPIIPVGGGGPPITYGDGGGPTEAGFFSGMDTTTLVLIGVAAIFLLPQLMRKRG